MNNIMQLDGSTVRSGKMAALPNKRTPQDFAEIIRPKWQANVANILQVCMWLETAKNELGPAGFVKLYRDELRWNKPMISKLLKIASDERVNDADLVSPGKLPAAWTMLYELCRLTDEQFHHGLDTGIIHAGMERKDIKELKPPKPKTEIIRKEKQVTLDDELEDWASRVRDIVWNAMRKTDGKWPSLFARLHEELHELEQNQQQYHASMFSQEEAAQCA